jgi:hypothetical protein
MHADAGIVISASHNPYQDNGIKIFGADGFKLPDEQEAEIELLAALPNLELLGVEIAHHRAVLEALALGQVRSGRARGRGGKGERIRGGVDGMARATAGRWPSSRRPTCRANRTRRCCIDS